MGGGCRNLAKILIVRADRIRPVKMLRMRSEDFLADERVSLTFLIQRACLRAICFGTL